MRSRSHATAVSARSRGDASGVNSARSAAPSTDRPAPLQARRRGRLVLRTLFRSDHGSVRGLPCRMSEQPAFPITRVRAGSIHSLRQRFLDAASSVRTAVFRLVQRTAGRHCGPLRHCNQRTPSGRPSDRSLAGPRRPCFRLPRWPAGGIESGCIQQEAWARWTTFVLPSYVSTHGG